ncbi:CX domain-containing protein [Caenorhabditis elegans]|uniref:CX domain-containing protein n=1 Tax=Caenorhabditis elegans TaxID=6239 RepID=Q19666_CAEEL|nr:CX domain-containing protein [Caenorhabditis elegans]CCD61435.1 CX domain-containing protein [Caenorhabditis elegans]|eukprot:NP_505366.1 Uncharacterized protein CELE_F21C10.4 [Caenorhabditis elegans]
MNTSFFIVLFSLLAFYEISAKSGGGGGRGGGGRGSSGARSSSRSFSRSGGAGGGKFHSSSSRSSYLNYDSSAFRSNVFKPTTSNSYFATGTSGSTHVIIQPATPIIYDNHHYYWHGYYRSHPEKPTICEYSISDEDGELFNVTFANSTKPKSITFGCGSSERCCGMECCNNIGDWLGVAIWFIVILVVICYSCCKD